jgi:hypothetical protein
VKAHPAPATIRTGSLVDFGNMRKESGYNGIVDL